VVHQVFKLQDRQAAKHHNTNISKELQKICFGLTVNFESVQTIRTALKQAINQTLEEISTKKNTPSRGSTFSVRTSESLGFLQLRLQIHPQSSSLDGTPIIGINTRYEKEKRKFWIQINELTMSKFESGCLRIFTWNIFRDARRVLCGCPLAPSLAE
jgi:hypothetical protein